MNLTLDALLGATSFGGVGLLALAGLLLVLRLVVPEAARPRLRGPALLLLAHVGLVGLIGALPPGLAAARPLTLLAVFVLLFGVARCLLLLAVDSPLGHRFGEPLPKIFRDILQGLLFIGVILLTMQRAGVEPGSLLTTSALLTAVIGLSLQDTLGNLFAGLSIQAQRPFEVGDWIQLDGDPRSLGRVVEINWRATKVITNDQVEVIIPNATLAKAPILNFTKPTPLARRVVEVTCAYDVAPDRVRAAIVGALRGLPSIEADPAPQVLTAGFADSGIRYQVRFHTTSFHARDALESSVRERVWYALRRAGIAIPYPTHDLRVTAAAGPAAAGDLAAERLAALRGVDVLAVLPEDALARLAARVEERVYAPDETILRQGEPGEELFIVERGQVRVIVGRPGGSSAELARLREGQFFGEMSLMTGVVRSATVQAVTECQLLVVDRQLLQQFLAASPGLAERISELLMSRQEQLDEHLASRAARSRPNPQERQTALLERIREFFSL